MLLALARVFLIEPLLGLIRFTWGEVGACGQLFRRVLNPDISERPTQESILANARDFFRFLSYWVILQVSVLELAGTDSDLVAEMIKYGILLCTYLFGFSASYGIAYLSQVWSRNDFLFSANVIADLYSLLFFVAFFVNLIFGRIDFNEVTSGDMQLIAVSLSIFALGTTLFIVLRRKHAPLHALTWVLVMAANFVIHIFNMFMLNQVVYQAV